MAAKDRKWVYYFGQGKADGKGDQKTLLGGKGAGLAEMTRIGLPVPGGFTITTEACATYYDRKKQWPVGLEKQIRENLAKLERACKKKLGNAKDPLLVSVRSGAARSMPGMMETILNLGLNDASVEGLAKASDNRRFAMDAYRRFIMGYGAIAMGISKEHFDHSFDQVKNTLTRSRLGKWNEEKIQDTDVNAEELQEVVNEFKRIYEHETHEAFPQDPFDQLRGAINAVFGSWMADKAVTYRRVENITGLAGTAVNVCQMVFGNMGDDSGTGVCFTRDPSTGENVFYGDLLINAQGEDVVAGIRTPVKLAELATLMPDVYEQLEAVRAMLEVHYKDMQDLEFTIERGKLYLLQCRSGKRSPGAAFKIAVDQATKGLLSSATAGRFVKKKYLPKSYAKLVTQPVINREDAIRRIDPVDIERLFYPVIDSSVSKDELTRRHLGEGIGAVPGAACGQIVFSAEEAETRAKLGTKVILVRKETSPEDVGGMFVASGILTATGGKTSHAAVVARGWGKCCIVGCESLNIRYDQKNLTINGRTLSEGDSVTLDGSAGRIYDGEVSLVRPIAPAEFETLMSWCDDRRRLRVRTNADTPADAARAVELGAEGIGLCRTEHMFFDPSQAQRIIAMREMILADSTDARRRALDKLLPYQRDDFEGVFTAMDGKPVTIRLLDPPLHEFLPQHDNADGQQQVLDSLNAPVRGEMENVAWWDHNKRSELQSAWVTLEQLQHRVDQLHEANPMLGHRGCRLCITFPEILEMQVRAIVEAAVNCSERGIDVQPEIMIPLSIDGIELARLVDQTREVADGVLANRGSKQKYLVGTMIETPRAALLADRMAESAEFFSFGTNDLTQMTMGISRDDAGKFLPDYLKTPDSPSDEDAKSTQQVAHSNGKAAAKSQAKSSSKKQVPIFTADPFQSIDQDGVGALVYLSCEKGRETRPNIKLGVCGEHGGDPISVRFFEKVGLDYVSCSPLRVPIARLAAAQSAIEQGVKVSPAKTKSSPSKQKASKKSAPTQRAAKPKSVAKSKPVSSKKSSRPAKAGKTTKKPVVKPSARKKKVKARELVGV